MLAIIDSVYFCHADSGIGLLNRQRVVNFIGTCTDKSIVIFSDNGFESNYVMQLFDVNGKMIKEYRNLKKGQHQDEIGDLVSGIYYLKVLKLGGTTQILKVMN